MISMDQKSEKQDLPSSNQTWQWKIHHLNMFFHINPSICRRSSSQPRPACPEAKPCFFSGRSTSPIRSFQDLRPCENHLLRCDARGFSARSFVNGGFLKEVYPQTIFMGLAIINIDNHPAIGVVAFWETSKAATKPRFLEGCLISGRD